MYSGRSKVDDRGESRSPVVHGTRSIVTGDERVRVFCTREEERRDTKRKFSVTWFDI